MTRYIAPDEIARIIPGEWQQAPVDPYNGDLAYRIFTYGIAAVALLVWVALAWEWAA
jgi:hypothetical protein